MVLLIFIYILILALVDSSTSSLVFMFIIYIIGYLFANSISIKYRIHAQKLFNIIYIAYITSSFVVSASFSTSDFFLLSDPTRYIDSYLNRRNFFYDLQDLKDCYLNFSDSNFLYNSYLTIMSVFANKYLGGMTIFSMTLCQVFWGVISSNLLYKILIRHVEYTKAYIYALIYALFSLTFFYSIVIVRDIIICFLYLAAFNIIDQKFEWKGVLKLILIIFFTWGVRLYSGIFSCVFLGYYLYSKMRSGSLKHIATFIFTIVLIIALGLIFASSIFEQTIQEFNIYNELSNERSGGGIVSKLQSLPIGISQIAIVLFIMLGPLPPLSLYTNVATFSHFLMSTLFSIAGIFWFLVFYSLLYNLIVKKYFLKIQFQNNILLLICLLFMLANATHPDIRRMLPVYPILFIQHIEICEMCGTTLFGSPISKIMIVLYIIVGLSLTIL